MMDCRFGFFKPVAVVEAGFWEVTTGVLLGTEV